MVHAVHLAALFVLAAGSPVRRKGRPVRSAAASRTAAGRHERAAVEDAARGRRTGRRGRDERGRRRRRLGVGVRVVAGRGHGRATRRQLDLAQVLLRLLVVMLLSYLVGVVWRWVRVRGRRTGRQADVLLGGSRTNLRPGVVVVYQRRRVNVRSVAGGGGAAASITSENPGRSTATVVVVVIVQLLVELLLAGRWQWRFDGSAQLLLLLLVNLVVMLLLLLVDEMLLLGRGHGQQPLPVVANDLPLVLRVLVRRPGHVAVAQGRWRRRMARTAAAGVVAAAAAAAVLVLLVRGMLLLVVAAAFILDLGEEKVLLVAVLFRFAGAQMCVSYVGRNLRTRSVDDTTTLPGAFVDRLAGPSFPRQILVVVHADALVRVGERSGPGATNHNGAGGTVSVVVVATVVATIAQAAAIAIDTAAVGVVVVVAGVAGVAVGRWCGMSILAERRRGRAGAPRGTAAAGTGAQDGFPAGRRGRVGRAGQTHKYQGSVAFVRRVLIVNTVILPIVL